MSAIDRAAEALDANGVHCSRFDIVDTVLRAALTDPGDPDWLARVIESATNEWLHLALSTPVGGCTQRGRIRRRCCACRDPRGRVVTAPEDVAQAAELLREHQARGFAFDDECRCGWAIPETLRDGPAGMLMRPDRRAHLTHQAEVLAAAGLIPTSTEWGVRFVGADEPMTYFHEADARLVATDIDADGLVSRAVTGWKDA